MSEIDSSYLLEVKTVQSSSFKVLIEALKELISDVTIQFDNTGLKIISTDNSKCILVHLKLEASKFEFFSCKQPIDIGLNMLNLYKLIKTINNNDILTLFIDSHEINYLGIKIENNDKNSKTVFKLNLLDLDNSKIVIDDVSFTTVINLPCCDFQKLCRDMYSISETVEIKNINNQLILSCVGDFCSQETIIIDNETGSKFINNKNVDEITQGIFSLKYLVLFTKCTNLCNTCELFIKNDYPIVIMYTVASLGTLKLCLTPLQV
jgi:proliferating cell nuclear antigen